MYQPAICVIIHDGCTNVMLRKHSLPCEYVIYIHYLCKLYGNTTDDRFNYYSQTRSCLLMSWILTSPGHQQSRYGHPRYFYHVFHELKQINYGHNCALGITQLSEKFGFAWPEHMLTLDPSHADTHVPCTQVTNHLTDWATWTGTESLDDIKYNTCLYFLNSLWPCDAIWWHKTGSPLAQVMACCLMAPSHYLKQCWLIIIEVFDGNFTSDTSTIIEISHLKLH